MSLMAHLERAREKIQQASERADGEVREQLLSIDEGLEELVDGDKTGSGEPEDQADRFREVEEKLRGLQDTADDEAETQLRNARDELDAYRRKEGLA
jgi:chromosome segregation ATPase